MSGCACVWAGGPNRRCWLQPRHRPRARRCLGPLRVNVNLLPELRESRGEWAAQAGAAPAKPGRTPCSIPSSPGSSRVASHFSPDGRWCAGGYGMWRESNQTFKEELFSSWNAGAFVWRPICIQQRKPQLFKAFLWGFAVFDWRRRETVHRSFPEGHSLKFSKWACKKPCTAHYPPAHCRSFSVLLE